MNVRRSCRPSQYLLLQRLTACSSSAAAAPTSAASAASAAPTATAAAAAAAVTVTHGEFQRVPEHRVVVVVHDDVARARTRSGTRRRRGWAVA